MIYKKHTHISVNSEEKVTICSYPPLLQLSICTYKFLNIKISDIQTKFNDSVLLTGNYNDSLVGHS